MVSFEEDMIISTTKRLFLKIKNKIIYKIHIFMLLLAFLIMVLFFHQFVWYRIYGFTWKKLEIEFLKIKMNLIILQKCIYCNFVHSFL